MESVTQLSLPLFDPPSFSDLLNERSHPSALSIVANPRLKRGWKVTAIPASDRRRLVIPCFLLDAPEEIKNTLIAWAQLPLRSSGLRKKRIRQQRALLEKTIWRYIESLPNAPRRVSRLDARAMVGATTGCRYDLREVFDSINVACFSGAIVALLRWGAAGSRTSYHAARSDRHGVRFNLITIAGAYNRPDVPRFAIEAVMHHEMLHIAIPPYRKNGRMVIHGREFKAAERKFRHFAQWRTWERNYLSNITDR